MKRFTLLLVLPALIFAVSVETSAASAGSDEPKLILIHLDAVSSEYFQRELQRGNLPNISSFFGEEGTIDHTITYFPSKTPTVISSLRSSESLQEVVLPGWKSSEAGEERVKGMINTFLEMAFSKSRLATTNLIYGLPIFNFMAYPAFVNVADYLKDYNILQFYWYNIDTHGHFNGEEAYLNEMAKFDRQFGRLARRLDDDVNVIIYSDHGMTFGRGVRIDSDIENLIGSDIAVYSFPTLYLTDGSIAEIYARSILEETEVDFTFIRKEENTVAGFHHNGEIFFREEDGKVSYEFTGEDIFGYEVLGYRGEYLSIGEWLELTYSAGYPMAPVNIYFFMKNEGSGDILTLFDHTKFHQTGYSAEGNHGGFTSHDMTVPLFMRGPQVEKLYNRDYYWLPKLFSDIEGIDFNQNPPRERHFLSYRYDVKRDRPVTEISFSPTYRMRYGANFYLNDFSDLDRADFWGKADLFRSYLTRFWVGGGVEYKSAEISPFLMAQYDIVLRRFVFQNSIASNRQYYFRLSYEAKPWLAFEMVNFNSFGIRVDF